MTMFQSPRGTRDLLPEDQPYWQFVLDTAQKKAALLGFQPITLPTFEDEKLFTRAIGEGTDIVDKELFTVSRAQNSEEENKSKYALRPEGTAGVVRAYLEHGMATWTQPVKLFYSGSMFRYDRPQKGRYREFQQFGLEMIGDDSPATDALVILSAWQIFKGLKLTDNLVIDINTLGDKECRPIINKALKDYFTKYKDKLCHDCQKRLEFNPLRLLDCKEASCEPIKAQAPLTVDLVDEECKRHFKAVLEYFDELDIPYNLSPYLVRGLDYYTRTTFEIREKTDERRQSSLGGGGRYDNLIEVYGGQPTPAIGYSLGLDRVVDLIKEKNIPLPQAISYDLCVIQLGSDARTLALKVVKELTDANFSVVTAPGKDALKGQLRLANKLNAKIAAIIGQEEVQQKTIILKNLEDGTQEIVPINQLLNKLRERIGS